jgi:hypothetical protein
MKTLLWIFVVGLFVWMLTCFYGAVRIKHDGLSLCLAITALLTLIVLFGVFMLALHA